MTPVLSLYFNWVYDLEKFLQLSLHHLLEAYKKSGYTVVQ